MRTIKVLLDRFGSIGIITASMLIGAAMSLLALPLLSRLYNAHDFGAYGLVIAFVSVLSTVSSLRLDQAILVAPAGERISLAVNGALSALVLSGLAFLVFAFVRDPFFAGAVALGVLSNSFLQLNYAVFFAEKKEVSCGMLNVLRTGMLVAAQLSLPFLYHGSTMIHGFYLQCMALLLVTSGLLSGRLLAAPVEWTIFRKYKDFVMANTPHALANSFSHNIPYYFVSHFLGPAAVGYYSLVDRILKVPINLFSQAIRQFYIRDFSSAPEGEPATRRALLASTFMAAVSAPFFIGLSFLPPAFFQWAFGPSWAGAGAYFSVLSFGYWAIFINPPISAYIIAVRRSDLLLRLQMIELVIKVGLALLVIALFGSGIWILASVSAALVFYNFASFFWVFARRK